MNQPYRRIVNSKKRHWKTTKETYHLALNNAQKANQVLTGMDWQYGWTWSR